MSNLAAVVLFIAKLFIIVFLTKILCNKFNLQYVHLASSMCIYSEMHGKDTDFKRNLLSCQI